MCTRRLGSRSSPGRNSGSSHRPAGKGLRRQVDSTRWIGTMRIGGRRSRSGARTRQGTELLAFRQVQICTLPIRGGIPEIVRGLPDPTRLSRSRLLIRGNFPVGRCKRFPRPRVQVRSCSLPIRSSLRKSSPDACPSPDCRIAECLSHS